MIGHLNPFRTFFVLLISSLILFVSFTRAESEVSVDTPSPIWDKSNAVLLKDLPKSLCAPSFKGSSEEDVQACFAENAMSMHTRVRLIDYWRGAGRLFIKAQHVMGDYIYTSWLESSGSGNFARDDDEEMFLPELDPQPDFYSRIIGKWDVTSWELNYDDPVTKGQLIIDTQLGPSEYKGVFHAVADPNYNLKGRHRYPNAYRMALHKVDQPVVISVNGNALTVDSRMHHRVDAERIYMLLLLEDKNLRGYAGSLRRKDKDWTDLPEILFTKSE